MKKLFYIIILSSSNLIAQKQVAFTFDDVPNASLGESILLQKIDSLKLPSAIFINEHQLDKIDIKYFENWVKNPLITLWNHTKDHPHYSKIGFDNFSKNIIDGEIETRKLANKHNKELKHFRAPYNDLGKDSIQQDSLKRFLDSIGYRISPFTIESSDWMFNAVYKNYIKQNNLPKAKEIGDLYISYTLKLFDFYDSLAYAYYKRDVKQIYLCHDNEINRDYINILYQKLKKKKYSFISFDEALEDQIYSQPIYFYKKYGISWFYRWVQNINERNNIGMAEPKCIELENEYKIIK